MSLALSDWKQTTQEEMGISNANYVSTVPLGNISHSTITEMSTRSRKKCFWDVERGQSVEMTT
jgi:hypothetical protein